MDRFDRFAAHLKATRPSRRRVVIRRVRGMSCHGSTSMTDKGQITVTINRDDPMETQLDTLVHEWGHVYDYDKNGLHGPAFGKGFSLAYEAWEEFAANE